MRRIVLDTDMGSDVDDALCLALALASPEIELAAVTTVTGDTVRRARIARRLLDLAGRPEVPVHAGCAQARTPERSFLWLGSEGTGVLERDDAPPIDATAATDALAGLLRAGGDVEVVAVGPLTNLAELLEREPGLAAGIARLTVMGGHLRRVAYGDCIFSPGVDYNLCSDGEASVLTLAADVPVRLVTADVTLQVWLTPDDLARIEAAGTPFHAALVRAVRVWTPQMRAIFTHMGATIADDNVAFLHDPLALAAVYDESFCRFEDLEIEPVVQDGVFRTLEHSRPGAATRTMRCATAVDAERFRAHFVERVAAFRPRAGAP